MPESETATEAEPVQACDLLTARARAVLAESYATVPPISGAERLELLRKTHAEIIAQIQQQEESDPRSFLRKSLAVVTAEINRLESLPPDHLSHCRALEANILAQINRARIRHFVVVGAGGGPALRQIESDLILTLSDLDSVRERIGKMEMAAS